MKKLKNALADKHGSSYILTCAVILFAVALISIVMQYTYVYHIASEQKSETQLKLDNYVTWECNDGSNYFWGHYFSDFDSAYKDLHRRTEQKIRMYRKTDRVEERKGR